MSSPLIQQALGLPLNDPPDDAVEASLPKPVRAILSAAGSIAHESDTLTKLIPELNDALRSYSAEATKLRNKMLLDQEKKAAYAALDWSNSEISGAIAVGTFFLGSVLCDSVAANGFQRFSTSVQRAFTAAAEYELGKIGTLALSGSLIGAASVLLGVGAGDGIETQMFQVLGEISGKLDAMAGQLSTIERQEGALLEELSKLYREFTLNAADTNTRLGKIQDGLEKLASTIDENEREKDQTGFMEELDHARKDLMPVPGSRNEAAIRKHATNFNDHAHFTSRKSIFTGNAEVPLNQQDMAAEVNRRHRVDLLFGLFPNMAQLIGSTEAFFGNDPADPSDRVPNPVTWSEGTNAYLSTRALAQEMAADEDFVRSPALWSDGIKIRRAMVTMRDQYDLALTATRDSFFGLPNKPGLLDAVVKLTAELEAQMLLLANRDRNDLESLSGWRAVSRNNSPRGGRFRPSGRITAQSARTTAPPGQCSVKMRRRS